MATFKQNSVFLEKKTTPAQRITITQYNQADKIIVMAPLDDNFGMTVGSEYSTPFDTGSTNSLLSKALFISGIAQKAAIRMKKYYSNPVPTEISFDMNFTSYYNAYQEVIIPAILLQTMSLGRTLKWDSLKHKLQDMINAVPEAVDNASNTVNGIFPSVNINFLKDIQPPKVTTSTPIDPAASKAVELFGLIESPPTTTIRFGNTFTLDNTYITHVGVKYSNILDTNGYPTSATVSITASPEEFPIQEDIYRWYSTNTAKKWG